MSMREQGNLLLHMMKDLSETYLVIVFLNMHYRHNSQHTVVTNTEVSYKAISVLF